MIRRIIFGGVMAAVGLVPAAAHACGLTPPIGPNGLPTVCHGDEDAWRFRLGLAGGGTKTRIEFGDRDAELTQGAATATLDVFPLERLGLSVSAGSALVGEVEFEGRTYDLLPGVLAGGGVSYRFLGKGLPFIHTSLTGSVARATSRADDGSEATFSSYDYRLGLAVGYAVSKVAAPFVVGRYFGAGTDWSVGGGKGADAFRYHVGVGSAFGLSEHWDALAEVAFLGEKRLTLGVGYLF